MSHRGDLLHGGRLTLGINQSHAAGLLGTSQANVSAYERGRLDPGRVVGERIDSLAVLSPDSIYARYQASTMAKTSSQQGETGGAQGCGRAEMMSPPGESYNLTVESCTTSPCRIPCRRGMLLRTETALVLGLGEALAVNPNGLAQASAVARWPRPSNLLLCA